MKDNKYENAIDYLYENAMCVANGSLHDFVQSMENLKELVEKTKDIKIEEEVRGNYNVELLDKYGDYALLKRNLENKNDCDYIVAYGYDKDTSTWDQGHYFESELGARKFYCEKSMDTIMNNTNSTYKINIIKEMNNYISKEFDGDEYAIEDWYSYVPDNAEYTDFKEIALDNEQFNDVVNTFSNIIKRDYEEEYDEEMEF